MVTFLDISRQKVDDLNFLKRAENHPYNRLSQTIEAGKACELNLTIEENRFKLKRGNIDFFVKSELKFNRLKISLSFLWLQCKDYQYYDLL